MTDPTGDPTGPGLHALLEDAVSDVEPRLGLDEIRARTVAQRPRRPWLRGAVTAGVAVAATAATVAAVTVVTDRSPEERTEVPPASSTSPDPTPTPSPSSGVAEPTATPSQGPTPAPTTSAGLLPVYYVGDTPAGPRLYREFVTPTGAEVDSARLLQALRDAVIGTPADPDYVTPWPTGWSVEKAGIGSAGGRKVIEIDVEQGTGASWPPDNAASDGRLALQQLVYTAQAEMQERLPVRFVGSDGLPLRSLLGVDVSQPMANDPEMQVLAPVWIIDPAEDAVVGPTFTVDGRGAFFEATVSWQLLRNGRVVEHGFTTADQGMTLSPYSFTVRDVPRGDYTLRVFEAGLSDGEGLGEQQDTKTVIVR